MSGNPTVTSPGATSVPASGSFTQYGISQIASLLSGGSSTVGLASALGARVGAVTVVPNGSGAVVQSLPSTAGVFEFGTGNALTITGGGASTTIVSGSSLSYSGQAAVVDVSGGPGGTIAGTITDNAAGAQIAVGGGLSTIAALGNRQTIGVDNGVVSVRATGTGDAINLGDPSGMPASAPSGTRSFIQLDGSGSTVNVRQQGAWIVDDAGSTTINGYTGGATILAATADVYQGAAASALFVGLGSTQTVFGGTGSDTVFAAMPDNSDSLHYAMGTGDNNLFIGATGDSTVVGNTTGNGIVFEAGGAVTDRLQGVGNLFIGVGNGGSGSINAGTAAATIFSTGTAETYQLVGGANSQIVALGRNETIDASAALGLTSFWVMSSAGNNTLIGSVGGSDNFNLQSQTIGASGSHTITVQNWHASDQLFLNGYDATDRQTMQRAIGSGKTSFTLSDGTTVSFIGDHPTHGSSNAIW